MPEPEKPSWSIAPRQKEGMELCRQKQFVLFSGPRLTGKCVSPDTLIYTAKGLSPISDLGEAVEDSFSAIQRDVLSLSSNRVDFGIQRAAQFYNSGFRKAFIVNTQMNYSLTCSTHHPIWSEHRGDVGFRTATEISGLLAAGERVWTPMVRENQHWPEDCVTVNGILLDDDIGYLLGLMIGDGSYPPRCVNKRQCVRFTTADSEAVEFINKVLGCRFDQSSLKFNDRYDYGIKSRGAKSLKSLLFALRMMGKYSYEKEIPSALLASPKSVIIATLQGLFDTDGTVDKHGYPSYCTSSLKLSKQVQQLLLAVGVRSSRKFKHNEHQGAWIILPRVEDGFSEKVGFRLKRKRERTELAKGRKFNIAQSSYPPSLIEVLKFLHSTRKTRGVEKLPRKTHKHVIDSVLRRNTSLSKKRLEPMLKVLKCENDSEVQKFVMGWNVWWDEISECVPSESFLVDLSVPETENFVGNGFINHNTEAALHSVVDHAWRTDKGNISVISVTQSAGLDSGIWNKLTRITIPQWINSGMGMKWVKKPYIANVTKRPCCSVTNAHGSVTEIQLDSLKYEHEVEGRFKAREFTCMYVPELSNFREKKTFDIWVECLRGSHLRDDQFLFLADTNPSDDGEDSWIFFLWFILPKLTYNEYCEYCHKRDLPVLSESAFDSYRNSIGALTFNIEHNIFLSKARVERLEATYFGDQDLYDRYILGLWKKSSVDALFHKVFRPNFHIVGEIETPGNPDPEILVTKPSTSRMPTGWDPGAGVNSAFAIVEKTIEKLKLPSGKAVEKSVFKVLDELVITGEDHSLDEFTSECVKKMEWWEDREGRPFDWVHWSDRSVFDMREPRHNKYYHQIIHEASEGLVTLRAADRGPGTVQQRINLLRKLLFEGRIFFSNDKCPRAIEMCRAMRPGTSNLQPIQKGSVHKHIFDAIMYCVTSEVYDELEDAVFDRIRTSRNETETESSLVSVPM